MPHGNQLSVVQINKLRLRAVQMRIAGSTLKAINQDTGLSSPTIISAYKAWQTGGWNAVPVRERGRKQGEGRSLSAEQEQNIYLLLSVPHRNGTSYRSCFGNWKRCRHWSSGCTTSTCQNAPAPTICNAGN